MDTRCCWGSHERWDSSTHAKHNRPPRQEPTTAPTKNQGTSLAHPLGIGNPGRDAFALLVGGRVSLAVGVAGGWPCHLRWTRVIGVLSRFFRRIDGPLIRYTDLFLALPGLPFLMVSTMPSRSRAVTHRALGL